MTRCGALVPLGGPAVCVLSRRPYFACRHQMITHINTLARYCETTWITRSHSRTALHRPYVYHVRKTLEEIEEASLRRALTGNLNTGLMPSMEHHVIAKGGSSGAFARTFFRLWGTAKFPRHRAPQPHAGGNQPGRHNASSAPLRPHDTPHARNTRCKHASQAAV